MKPEVFITLEESVSSTISAGWHKIAADLATTLEPLIKSGKFGDAHVAIDKMHLNGVVKSQENRIEELLVSSLLFGAHNCAGHVSKTAFIQKNAPIPDALKHAVAQLVVMVEQNGADMIRKELHAVVADEELLARRLKAAEGGISTISWQSLYVNRPLLNTDDLLDWATAQGFPSSLNPDDLHVTICYSKLPVDWTAIKQDPTSLNVGLEGDRRVSRFGDAIVLQFESKALQSRWQMFQDIGASWDYDEYRPHLTISYDPNFNVTDVEPYTGPIHLGGEEFAPVKDNWADDIEEVELRKAEASLADRLNDALLNGKQLAIDTSANLTTSRLVTLGYLAEAKDRGVTEYQIDEVLDNATCPICRYMHGKTFKVESEYSRVLQALMTQDPKQLKDIAPWPKQSKAGLKSFREKSLEQIQADGQGAPPFHPGCRGQLANVGTVEEIYQLGKLPIPGEDAKPAKPTQDLDPVTVVPASPFGGSPVPSKPSAPIIPSTDKLYSLIDRIQDQKAREKALGLWNSGHYEDLQDLLTTQNLL